MATVAGWSVKATATAGIATATKSAETAKTHVVFAVSASLSAAVTGGVVLQIKDGTTVVWEQLVGVSAVPFHAIFPAGIAGTNGNAVSAVLASGGGAVVGNVALHGITL